MTNSDKKAQPGPPTASGPEPKLTVEKVRELLAEGRAVRREIERDIHDMRQRTDPQTTARAR